MKIIKGASGALLFLCCCAPLLQGALQISYSINGGAPVICGFNPVSAGPATCPAVVDATAGLSILVLSANSNSPGTPALSEQFGANLFIQSTKKVDVTIYMASQDFTAPVSPPNVNYASNLSVTSTTGTGTVALTSCVDGANGLTPPTTPICASPEATLTNGPLAYAGASSPSSTVTAVVTIPTIPYGLDQTITLALNAGSNLNIITSQVLTPVPEPMSIVLLGGVIVLTTGAIRRKRNRAASAV